MFRKQVFTPISFSHASMADSDISQVRHVKTAQDLSKNVSFSHLHEMRNIC